AAATAASASAACTSTIARCESGSGVSSTTDASRVTTDQPAGAVNVAPPGVASDVSADIRPDAGVCAGVVDCARANGAPTEQQNAMTSQAHVTVERRIGDPLCGPMIRPRRDRGGEGLCGQLRISHEITKTRNHPTIAFVRKQLL